MLIDAHHHLWKYNNRDYVWMTGVMSSLQRDFLIPDLQKVMRDSEIKGTVAVQARQTIAETEWLLKLAAQYPFLFAVVGWVPLTKPKLAAYLDQFVGNSKLKGVRHVLHDEPDDFFMMREDFNNGVNLLRTFDLSYDILVFERHLPQTIEFVDRHPGQIFIIDHIAKPKIKENLLSPWKENIAELAKRENVYCKISGMVTESDWEIWTTEQLRPYFDVVLSAFSPKRLMFGSDWPVVTLASSYGRWVNTFRSFVADLTPDEQYELYCGTVQRAYRL